MNSNQNVEDIIPSSKIIEEKRTLDSIIEMIQQSTKIIPDVFESRFKSRQNYIDKYNGTTQLPNQIEYLRIILDADIILFCIRQGIMKGNKSESKKMEEWKTFPFDGGKIFMDYKQKRFHANSGARDVTDTVMEKLVGNIDPILKSTKLKEPLLVKGDDSFQEKDIDSIPLFFDMRKSDDKDKKDNRVEWSNYGVAFLEDEYGTILVRLISPNLKDELKHPYNCGLYKNQSNPNATFEMLYLFAGEGKTLNPLDYPKFTPNAFSQRIKRCNKWLMEKFELSEKPIRKYSKSRTGYTSWINISIEYRKGKDAMDFTDNRYSNPE